MTTITAKIIADSIGEHAPRLTTFQLRYPRFIHAELMTHRVFSRNASSSRAVPVKKMISNIREDTAMPIHWGKNQSGMQAREENDRLLVIPTGHTVKTFMTREQAWLEARDSAISIAEAFDEAGYHKQIVNRLLEPFMYIDGILTATDFANWFYLRCHPDAQPEIQKLATEMYTLYSSQTPTMLEAGDWHLPYITSEDRHEALDNGVFDLLPKLSTARCARVSYLKHDGSRPTIEEDLALYERLVGSQPMHASPAEHQAQVDDFIVRMDGTVYLLNTPFSGNLAPGWVQYRKLLPDENITRLPEDFMC